MNEEKTLHAGLPFGLGGIWMEHKVEFEFTKRIKYKRYNGLFYRMYLEIEWEGTERIWYTFWKKTPMVYTKWICSESFEDRFPHKRVMESHVVDCA